MDTPLELGLIIASTRPGRKGPAIADWMQSMLRHRPEFHTVRLDLAEINLPFLDESEHPRLRKYLHDHTRRWSEMIDAIDAFIVVTPEYNYGIPATLKNALDFLYQEWGDKPMAVVSYGGIAGGTRAVQMLRQVMTSLRLVSVVESVNIPFFAQHINPDGVFRPPDSFEKSAGSMLDEVARLAVPLKELRTHRQQRPGSSGRK